MENREEHRDTNAGDEMGKKKKKNNTAIILMVAVVLLFGIWVVLAVRGKKEPIIRETDANKVSKKQRSTGKIAKPKITSCATWVAMKLEEDDYLTKNIKEERKSEVENFLAREKAKYIKYRDANKSSVYYHMLINAFFDSPVVKYILVRSSNYIELLRKNNIVAKGSAEIAYSEQTEKMMMRWLLAGYSEKVINLLEEIFKTVGTETPERECMSMALGIVVNLLASSPPKVSARRPVGKGGKYVSAFLKTILNSVRNMEPEESIKEQLNDEKDPQKRIEINTNMMKMYELRRKMQEEKKLSFEEQTLSSVLSEVAGFLIGMLSTNVEYLESAINKFTKIKAPYFGRDIEGFDNTYYKYLFEMPLEYYNDRLVGGYSAYLELLDKSISSDIYKKFSSEKESLCESWSKREVLKSLADILISFTAVSIEYMDYFLSAVPQEQIREMILDFYVEQCCFIQRRKEFRIEMIDMAKPYIDKFLNAGQGRLGGWFSSSSSTITIPGTAEELEDEMVHNEITDVVERLTKSHLDKLASAIRSANINEL